MALRTGSLSSKMITFSSAPFVHTNFQGVGHRATAQHHNRNGKKLQVAKRGLAPATHEYFRQIKPAYQSLPQQAGAPAHMTSAQEGIFY
jgi:hypothetical protein